MATLEPYRGIEAEVRRFDEVYAGRLLVPGAVVNFRSDARDGVVPAFHAAVEAYLAEPERYRETRVALPPAADDNERSELRYDTWKRSVPPRR